MIDQLPIPFWLALFAVTAGAIFLSLWKQRTTSVGLVYGFVFILSLLHLVGSAFYLRDFPGSFPRGAILAGLQVSTYAILSFATGVLVLAPLLLRWFPVPKDAGVINRPHRDLPMAYLAVGFAGYILGDVLRGVPSMAAVSSVGEQFLIVGICLKLRQAWMGRNIFGVVAWAAATFALPFFTIVTQGFLSYGAMASFTILCFLSNSVRSLWRFGVGAALLGMLFLSFYVSYMRDRNAIRGSVWGGQSMEDRVDRVTTMMGNLEWFNPMNDDHARRIDGRLNQDYLVGKAVEFLAGRDTFARGETIRDSLLAVIPRAIWPDKPVGAGSGDLVTRFTGIRFAEGTSVGIGQVMEWYVNFATPGVVAWLLAVGAILRIVDLRAGRYLRNGNLQAFSIWYLPSLALLNISGSMVELSASLASGVVVGLFVNRVVLQHLQKKRRRVRLGRYAADVGPSIPVN